MDPVALIEHANEVGLDLRIVDGALRIRGPRRLSGLVELLSANKDEVMGALSSVAPQRGAAREMSSSLSADTDTRPKITAEDERVSAHAGPNQEVQEPSGWGHKVSNVESEGNSTPSGLQLAASAARLCGSGSPRPSPVPPPEIWADPVVICPRCSGRRVLSELREFTKGVCYRCWEGPS